MIKWFLKLIFRLNGWKIDPNLPDFGKRAVMMAAPHTSNWDFVYTIAAFDLLNIPIRFTIKKEWLKWPFKNIFLRMGAVPIDRSPKEPGQKRKSMVEAMVDLFMNYDDMIMMVTPEGTRGKRTKWKTGFYHVARQAGVPISFGYLDYEKKIAGVGKVMKPTDDMDKDMKEIMEFYGQLKGKIPSNFSIDLDYK